MKRRITEKSEERVRGWGWVYWVRLGRADLGRVAGQVRERVERGLRDTEGGQKGNDKKKKTSKSIGQF